jgi:hypothetical protein
MLELADELTRLRKEVLKLRDHTAGGSGRAAGDTELEERPPHY